MSWYAAGFTALAFDVLWAVLCGYAGVNSLPIEGLAFAIVTVPMLMAGLIAGMLVEIPERLR